MNTMKWLVRRELWEHKGAFVWTPMFISAVLVVLMLGSAIWGSGHVSVGNMDGVDMQQVRSAPQLAEAVKMIASTYLLAGAPVFAALGFVVFLFCVGTLSDERHDKSVLFWKSLPISDGQTVASKAAMALLIAPFLACLGAIVVGLVALVVISILAGVAGVSILPGVLATPATYLAPLKLLSLVPVYALCALPAVGWLMLVGVAAPNKALLWAVGLPVIAGVLVSWTGMTLDVDTGWFWRQVVSRALLGVFPGSWLAHGGTMTVDSPFDHLVSAGWASLTTARVWIGAAAGAGMLVLATRMRRFKDEG